MARDRVSPRSAARALCLSGCQLMRFLRLHFIVVRIFHTSEFVGSVGVKVAGEGSVGRVRGLGCRL